MALSRQSTRSTFSNILISTPKLILFFANACAVSNLEAFCGSWCRMRVSTCEAYAGPWELLAEMRPLDRTVEGWRDRWLGQIYQTKMQFMNAIFRQGYEHRYAYDEETLTFVMREAGFADVVCTAIWHVDRSEDGSRHEGTTHRKSVRRRDKGNIGTRLAEIGNQCSRPTTPSSTMITSITL